MSQPVPEFCVFLSHSRWLASLAVTVRTSHNMDPVAFAPSEELREDIIYSVKKLIDLWLNHSGREFHCATATGFQSPLATELTSPTQTGFPPQHTPSSRPQPPPLPYPALRRKCFTARWTWNCPARRSHRQGGSSDCAAGTSPHNRTSRHQSSRLW